ncbi:MAG: helix-turn-helix transcriptional regulator [Gammaproteobacteria bacterium]|nr:helix-turn-helix transcriptional regulator [Gammaproteobacteria bacterium]
MEMQVNASLLKQERSKRAWSQEHLAQVTGLGLRTVQRIESSGMASNESIASIATVFEMTVAQFMVEATIEARNAAAGLFQKNRLWITLAIVVVAQVVSPPQLTVALACLWVWVAFELGSYFVNKRSNPESA